MLTDHGIAISMTENGDPYENAIAERVNGILKGEFDLYSSKVGFKETTKKIRANIEVQYPATSCKLRLSNPNRGSFSER